MTDDDRGTFNLIDARLNKWPDVHNNISIYRAAGVSLLAEKTSADVERTRIRMGLEQLKPLLARFNRTMVVAFDADSGLKRNLVERVEKANQAANLTESEVRSRLLVDGTTTSPEEWSELMTKVRQPIDELAGSMHDQIITLLEARLTATRRNAFGLVAIVGLILVSMLVFVLFIVRSIVGPLGEAVERARDIAEGEGDLTRRIAVDSKDEVGTLGKWMNSFMGNLDGVVSRIYGISTKLSDSSALLAQSSQSISAGSEEMSVQSQTIASSATQMNQNLQMLSSAIEEMSISVQEVAKKAGESASVAREANKTTIETDTIVQALGENAREIGQVIESIASIASQTNLLALNAAIEAAGAGEAGKGFAVVAQEVKELARQTAESSEEIKSKIAAIQKSSEKTVEAIQVMKAVIGRVNDISTAIASSVEEQSITAREIASNIAQASSASNEVTKNINGISQASKQGAKDSEKSSQLAGDLHRMATDLSGIVRKFKFSGTTVPSGGVDTIKEVAKTAA